MMKKLLILTAILTLVWSCGGKQQADLIVHNATVYTVNDEFSVSTAFAIKDGKFVGVGTDEEVLANFESDQIMNLDGAPVYPGLIDAHAHFYRYGLGLKNADLVGTKSFDEILEILQAHREKYPDDEWIVGRGWDQNDWENKEFPSKEKLDKLFPDVPVFLSRVDGHAALANSSAMSQSEIFGNTKEVTGGKIYFDKNGEPTGLLVDNAMDLIGKYIPQQTRADQIEALIMAQENCFKVGLTSIVDAGLEVDTIELIDSLNKAGKLKMRLYTMVAPSEESIEYFKKRGKIKTDYLNVRSFKVYGDGALGSRGANLLSDYSDDPGNSGFLLETEANYDELAKTIYDMGFQMNTHCIGDRTDRVILDIYAKYLPEGNDLRWKIEHAQVVSNEDVPKFGKYNVVPSVQPTHATSDMYWAAERLGEERVKTAYAFKDLLDQNGYIALGSDFPVEDINPLYGYHAAVARQDSENWPEGGWQPENKLSREEALKGMTIWAAYSNFEENEKGSIEVGKFADFIITEKDMMKAPESELRNLKVKATYLNGKKVY
ncbi:amidohydrolase [uncultured Roseivirga sp.]|uniref:amidohydrolase n=1 Tax=uncultured Roseivirga sp. TaxID=543088 RepID=UPI0030D708C1|tara:strand:- start:219340 stop:220977 length:1638 start_codon:yes stop_codon:yes gene_type:complete